MKTIQRSYLLFSILLFTQQNIDAQEKKGKWIQRDVTIDYAENLNGYLLTNANTISYISNADGKHARLGRYLFIKNNSADAIFYRSSPAGLGDYIKKDAIFFTATTSNMLQYYPVLPGHSDLISNLRRQDASRLLHFHNQSLVSNDAFILVKELKEHHGKQQCNGQSHQQFNE